MTHYDRYYDMGHMAYLMGERPYAPNVLQQLAMREPGVEPGYLAVPDPKSHRTRNLAPPAPRSLVHLDAPQRSATENDAPTTTVTTTCVPGRVGSPQAVGR